MAAWTQELKDQVIKMYTEAAPTPETSTEIIKDIAEEVEQSPNGVRMVLVQAQVYVKKEAGAASKDAGGKTAGTKKSATGEAKKRVSKEDSIAELRAEIENKGATVDDDILSKLTGKAAIYFLSVLKHGD